MTFYNPVVQGCFAEQRPAPITNSESTGVKICAINPTTLRNTQFSKPKPNIFERLPPIGYKTCKHTGIFLSFS